MAILEVKNLEKHFGLDAESVAQRVLSDLKK